MPTKKITVPDKWINKVCRDPEHNIPNMRYFEPGTYEHTCPKCKRVVVFTVPDKFWLSSPNEKYGV